jgi:hypothetical protein
MVVSTRKSNVRKSSLTKINEASVVVEAEVNPEAVADDNKINEASVVVEAEVNPEAVAGVAVEEPVNNSVSAVSCFVG